MSTKENDQKISAEKTEIVTEKREFIKKFGKYAIVGAGMTVLMTPAKSSTITSGVQPT